MAWKKRANYIPKQSAFRLEGIDVLKKNLEKILANVSNERVEQELLDGVGFVSLAMKSRAPVGPTGNLKNSITAKLLKSSIRPRNAFAGVEREKKGYHVHLVEYGTNPRRWKKLWKKGTMRGLASKKTGQFFGKEVAPMPAKPFLRPAVDSTMPAVRNFLEARFKRMIENF